MTEPHIMLNGQRLSNISINQAVEPSSRLNASLKMLRQFEQISCSVPETRTKSDSQRKQNLKSQPLHTRKGTHNMLNSPQLSHIMMNSVERKGLGLERHCLVNNANKIRTEYLPSCSALLRNPISQQRMPHSGD